MAAHCPLVKHTLRALMHAERTEEEHFPPKNQLWDGLFKNWMIWGFFLPVLH